MYLKNLAPNINYYHHYICLRVMCRQCRICVSYHYELSDQSGNQFVRCKPIYPITNLIYLRTLLGIQRDS